MGTEKNTDQLCDQIGQLHSDNKELSARLANVERILESRLPRRSEASVTRGLAASEKLMPAHTLRV